MAFPPNRKGKQITASDRQVWHELQEWLGMIFTKDALIAGRDRFIIDEMYLQSFEMYAEQRFVLIICSDRGKGKSIRAERLAKLLPSGFTSTQAASSARAGMNGNMSPNNGTMIIFDEMTKDLTPHEVDERVEYWKRKHFANRSQLGVLPLTVCSCALVLLCSYPPRRNSHQWILLD